VCERKRRRRRRRRRGRKRGRKRIVDWLLRTTFYYDSIEIH